MRDINHIVRLVDYADNSVKFMFIKLDDNHSKAVIEAITNIASSLGIEISIRRYMSMYFNRDLTNKNVAYINPIEIINYNKDKRIDMDVFEPMIEEIIINPDYASFIAHRIKEDLEEDQADILLKYIHNRSCEILQDREEVIDELFTVGGKQ